MGVPECEGRAGPSASRRTLSRGSEVVRSLEDFGRLQIHAGRELQKGDDPRTDHRRGFTRIPGLASKRDRFLTSKKADYFINALFSTPRCRRGRHLLLGRPADCLPPGTVGQWLPAPCNGGPCARAATRQPTRRRRLGTQAGIPKRTRPKLPPDSTLEPVRTVVAPFAVAGCGNCKRAMVSRLGKTDLRPYLIRLRSSFNPSTKC